jgi:DNA-binding MarR family transcriptional regulator
VSVLDDFRAAEQRVAQRLKELEPAVAEYRELEAVAKQLGLDSAAVTAASAPRAPAGRASRPRRARATTTAKARSAKEARAGSPRGRASGGREQQLLELVGARPGITVREAGTEFGIDPTSLYRVVHRLEKNGQLRKTGRGLEPIAS